MKTSSESEVFTEEPEEELWRSLLQFSYKANIRRYFDEYGIRYSEGTVSGDGGQNDEDQQIWDLDELSNHIAGALLQADEYYKASKVVSLQVEPLLLYYGTTNLLYAMTVLKTGKVPDISDHGMRIMADKDKRFIADTEVIFRNYKKGGVHKFAEQLGLSVNLCDYKDWKLGDFLDSVAEISTDFNNCYPNRQSHVLMLEVIRTADSVVEKISDDINTADSNIFSQIEDFSASYLTPEPVSYLGRTYVVLRHKMNFRKIARYSYSGQPYLQISHEKNGKNITIPPALNMYIALFALGSLCRYNPEIWNPFVIQDSTGEKLLIQKLLYYARRMLPNVVLNQMLRRRISFVSDRYTPEDRNHFVSEHEVKEIVKKEIRDQMRMEEARDIVIRK